MQLFNSTRAQLCLISLLFTSALGAATFGQQTITTSTTPAALSCSTQRYVNKLTVRVIPGFEGKVFIGTSTMNTSTYAKTLAILYPNAGAHSEEYVVQDPSGDDGIDLCSIYTAGGISNERAIAEYISNGNGTTAPTYLFQPTYNQIVTNSDIASLVSYTKTYYSLIRFQIIPGNEGKQSITYGGCSGAVSPTCGTSISTYTGEVATLYPNTGTLSQHNAWSEFVEIKDSLGNNGLWVGVVENYVTTSMWSEADLTVTPGVSGEGVLFSLWQKKTSAGAVKTPTVTLALQVGNGGGYAYGVFNNSCRVVPGYGGKAWIGVNVNTSTNAGTYAILYPNNTGSLGWSEPMSFGEGETSNFDFYGSGSAIDCFAMEPQSAYGVTNGTLPTPLSSYSSESSGPMSLSGNTSINQGTVKYLRVQVVPGETGKIFIGASTMNTSTLSGVYAILYPNSTGRWSERFVLEDLEGDGIPTNSLYVAAQVSGEAPIVTAIKSGVTPTDGVMSVKYGGTLAGGGGSYGVAFAGSSTPYAILRAQAIPGNEGKLWIGDSSMTAAQPDSTYANALKVLWPSEGDYSIGEGWSETYQQSCRQGPASQTNCLNLTSLKFWPYLSTEELIVFALGR